MNQEEFHKRFDVGLLPEGYSQLAQGQKVGFIVARAGWSVSEALRLLDTELTMQSEESIQNLHEMAGTLQQQVEELFWRTHPSAWRKQDS